MKKVFVQASTLLLAILITGSVAAQGMLTGITKKITVTNDALSVDIKQGSIKYDFYATMPDGSVSLVKSGTLAEPTDKTNVNDLSLSKTNSSEITLVITAACDACAAVVPKPDGISAPELTKELISTQDVAVIDVKAAAQVDYELWIKKTPFSDFEKDEKQSGSLPAPKDLSLANDIVLTSPDSYEIKVVVTSPAGDAGASVSFKEK